MPGLVSAALLVAVPELRRTGLSSWQGGGHILTARPPPAPPRTGGGRRHRFYQASSVSNVSPRCDTADASVSMPKMESPESSTQTKSNVRRLQAALARSAWLGGAGLVASRASRLVMRTSSCAPIRGVMRNAKFTRVAPCRCCCCVPGVDVGAGGAHAHHERADGFDGGAPERGAHQAAASRESKRGACQELECSGVMPTRIRFNVIHKTTEFTKRLGSCFQFRSRS